MCHAGYCSAIHKNIEHSQSLQAVANRMENVVIKARATRTNNAVWMGMKHLSIPVKMKRSSDLRFYYTCRTALHIASVS